MAHAFVSVLLEKLGSIALQQAGQEVRLAVCVEEEVGNLKSNLEAISVVLEDAERRQLNETNVRWWLDKLKDVSYDMDDVLDEWNTAILKMQIEGNENASMHASMPHWEVCSFIQFCFWLLAQRFCSFIPFSCFCFWQLAQRCDIANKIKKINKRLDVISKQKDSFHFISVRFIEEPERRMIANASRMTDSDVDVSEVHGRDEDKKKIVEMLLRESSEAPTLCIISILGMGGVGKTTLAQLVYNDNEVIAHFKGILIWVCVSDPFDEIRIAKAILESLENDAPNLNELNSLLGRIRQLLEDKKFLLVLDDVWIEDHERWEKLKNCLKCGSRGSRILVTTRKEKVAIVMGTARRQVFPLGTLSKEDCWSLFSRVAFSERTSKECERLKDIGEKIVDKCKGLPLAVKTLGGLLCFKRTRYEWQNVLNSEVWELEDEGKVMFAPLLLSYYDLSPRLRRCFLYCAIFPKGYDLYKDELIKLWMAQDYLKATKTDKMEMIGEECFENLKMRSFFQDFRRSENGNIIRCKMHDIVHDFVQFLTKNECLVMEKSSHEELMMDSSYENARHIMVMISIGFPFPISIYNLKDLRSLIVNDRAFQPLDLDLPKLFDQLTCLRALDFSRVGLKKLPNEVGKLLHLRYLNVKFNDKLEILPEAVCELCNLQILNVHGCKSLKQLPLGLRKLIKLRSLENWGTSIKYMPKGIERLTCLRKLDKFVVSDGDSDDEASSLGALKNLTHLRGELLIEGLGKVRYVDEVKKAQLENKEHLISLGLKFNWGDSEERIQWGGFRGKDERVIEVIQPPPNLEELKIEDYKGITMFPDWMMSLTSLKRVEIADCCNCKLLPPLGKLCSLESLLIKNMKSVKRVGIEFFGIENEVNTNEGPSSVIAFPKLEDLWFHDMHNWEEWDYEMRIIMPHLHSLKIWKCPKLEVLPDHLLQSPSLKELVIRESLVADELYYKEREGKDWPKISHIPHISIDGCYVQKYGHQTTGWPRMQQ